MTADERAVVEGLYQQARRAEREAKRAAAAAEEASSLYLQSISAFAFACGCPGGCGLDPSKGFRWLQVVERDPSGKPHRTKPLIQTAEDET
jgi:hypothetical protein